MKEKEPIKVSLSTFFLIIAIMVIIVMGYFMYQFYNEKVIATKESAELKTQVNNLQGKIDNIEDTINSNTSTENSNIPVSNETSSFTNEQVKKALTDYLELRSYAGCDALLENLKEKGKLNYDSSKDTSLDDGTVITSVKFSDYKNAMLNYVSESEFEKNWISTIHFNENSNGYLTKVQGGGGLRVYTINNIIKTSDSTYSAKTTATLVDLDDNAKENEDFTFGIKSYNGNCVISYCD